MSNLAQTTNDIKNGSILNLDGQLWQVIKFQHVKPGKGPAFVRTTIKNVLSGKIVDKTFNAGMKMEFETVDNRTLQYSYEDGDNFVFMDMTTYDQMHMDAEATDGKANYLKDGQECRVLLYNEKPLDIEIPASLVLEVTETEPGSKGDTVSNVTKPATLETGVVIQVPIFVNIGDRVKVDTRTREYLGRD